jgi:membrane associated rhomboid family serine protease
MIPLKDLTPRRTFPIVTLGLIAVNTWVFIQQIMMPERASMAFLTTWGFVPARVALALTSPHVSLFAALVPLFTSMFLHAGWLHIIGNMWFLWIFGDNVEDALGHVPFLLFYLACGIVAGLTQLAFSWGSRIPSVGASGAISGVLGAYLVLYPTARVLTLVPLFIIWFTTELPAMIFIGLWFVLQFLSGLASLGAYKDVGGVAFWAHVGGFVAGIAFVLGQRRRRRAAYTYG